MGKVRVKSWQSIGLGPGQWLGLGPGQTIHSKDSG